MIFICIKQVIALSQRIKRMESEFQLEFATLVFQSHSEIMLKMIQIFLYAKLLDSYILMS